MPHVRKRQNCRINSGLTLTTRSPWIQNQFYLLCGFRTFPWILSFALASVVEYKRVWEPEGFSPWSVNFIFCYGFMFWPRAQALDKKTFIALLRRHGRTRGKNMEGPGPTSPIAWKSGNQLPWVTQPSSTAQIPPGAPAAAQAMGDAHGSLSGAARTKLDSIKLGRGPVPSCPGDGCPQAPSHAQLRHSPNLLCARAREESDGQSPPARWPVCCLLWMF